MGLYKKKPLELIKAVKNVKNRIDRKKLSKYDKDDWSAAMDHSIHCLNRDDCLKLVQAYSSMVRDGSETKKEGINEWLLDGITLSVLLLPVAAMIALYIF